MNIYPAIDLKSGECVRLYRGSFDQMVSYEKDPIQVAKTFAQQGATFLHVVDLDGAKEGESRHLDLILQMAAETDLQIQIGGGIRTKDQVEHYLNNGIARVILGSVAISEPDLVREWLEELGSDRIVLALDIRMTKKKEPQLATEGWLTNSKKSLWQLLDRYKDSPLKHVLCTDIDRDGTLEGPNINLYQQCREHYPMFNFQASGGISGLNDLRELKAIPVAGAIIGKAIYEKKFSLSDALIEVKSC